MLEATQHESSSFVTLTYSDDYLPDGGSVCPRDLQLFFKRLRKSFSGVFGSSPFRYYAVAEYGDRTWRPHYHIALYGLGPESAVDIARAWNKGHVVVGTLTTESAQYIGGYVTKKLTKKDDPRLQGRHPEFARMSLRPGIGAGAMNHLADILMTKQGSLSIAMNGDVPVVLRSHGKNMPLGRYLRSKLREKLDIPSPGLNAPYAKEARELLLDMWINSENIEAFRPSMAALLVDSNRGKIRSIEGRYSIFSKDKKL